MMINTLKLNSIVNGAIFLDALNEITSSPALFESCTLQNEKPGAILFLREEKKILIYFHKFSCQTFLKYS